MPGIFINTVFIIKRFNIKDLVQNQQKVKQQLQFFIGFAWPLVIHSLSYLILAQADRIMIGKILGNSEAGLYSVAYSIASVIIVVQSAALQVLSPWIYQKMDAKDYIKRPFRVYKISAENQNEKAASLWRKLLGNITGRYGLSPEVHRL